MVLFTAPVAGLRCRIYSLGDTEVDFIACTDECAVTIYSTGSSWRYFRLNCEQHCLPINESHFGVPYITTCCSYDLCSLHVFQEASFLGDVKVKQIYETSFSPTSTAFITSTRTPVEPMFTSSQSSSSNTSSKLHNDYYNVLNLLTSCNGFWILVSGCVIIAIVLVGINVFCI